jgi:hypothetical protein
MWVVLILGVENNKIKIKNIWSINLSSTFFFLQSFELKYCEIRVFCLLNSALFLTKFKAKMKWVLAIWHVEISGIEI